MKKSQSWSLLPIIRIKGEFEMNENKHFFRASAEDFKKIPGSAVAYWVREVTCGL